MSFTAHVSTHKLTVSVLPFLSAQAATRQIFLSPEERAAYAGEVIIPPEWIGKISIDDSISRGASFDLTIANGAHRWFMPETVAGLPGGPGPLRFSELLDPGNFLSIREGPVRTGGAEAPKIFAGRVNEWTHSGSPESGESSLQVSGGGMENAFVESQLFIDFENKPSQAGNLQTPATVAASPAARLITAINNIASTVKELNDPALLIQQVLTILTTQFRSSGTYGGRPYASLFDISTGISKLTYTKAFIHVLNWFNQAQFGARLSYWDMLQSLATPPLYELFVSHDNNPIFVDESTVLSRPNEATLLGTVVFRKTPFPYLADAPPAGTNPNPAIFYVLPESKIKNFRPKKSESDIFSGVNVNLGILDTTSSLAINPVTYTPALVEKFAQRVLPVTLEGVGFPERNNTDESALKANLLALQNLISDVFCQAPGSPMPAERAVSGEISIHYSSRPEPDEYGNIGGVAKGKILRVVPDRGGVPHEVLKYYDDLFYIDAVRTSFSPETGETEQVLSVKWGRQRSRNPKSYATVMKPPY